MPNHQAYSSLNQDPPEKLIAPIPFPGASSPRAVPHQLVDPPSADGYSADGASAHRAPDTINKPAPSEWRPMMPPDLFSADVGVNAIAVYGVLALHVNGKTGECFPSYATIGERLGLSRKTVYLAIKQLEKCGFVLIEDRHKNGRSNVYTLPHQKHTRVTSDTPPVSPVRTPRVTDDIPPVSPVTPELNVSELNVIETNEEELTPVVPTVVDPPKPVETPKKPRTERQLAQDRLFERRTELFGAYCRGVGIDPDSFSGKQRQSRAFRELTPVLDAEDMTIDVMEHLSRFSVAAFRWRKGNATPYVIEVLNAFPEWDQQGRPAAPTHGAKAGNGAIDGMAKVRELEALEAAEAAGSIR